MRKSIIILLLGGLLHTGCADWVDVVPENSVTYTSFFQTEKDAAALLYSIEIYLRKLPLRFTEYGENVDYRVADREEYLPEIFDVWQNEYRIIDAANLLIENAWRFPLSEEVLKPYLLQAYFAKAQAYFQLVRDFGEAPIILEGGLYEPRPQSPATEVLAEAEKWALKAMELPCYENLNINNVSICKQYGSKGAAAALLAHIYAWRAGVLEESAYWSKAEEYCTMIIDGETGFYDLAATPEAVCVDVLKGESNEGIWEMYANLEEMDKISYFYGVMRNVLGFPIVKTATPTDDTLQFEYYYVSKKRVNELYDTADLRLPAYFWHPEVDSIFMIKENGETKAIVERGHGEVLEKYGNNKKGHVNKFRYGHHQIRDDFPYPLFDGMEMNVIRYRLADIILLRAECRARQGKADAVDDLNRIRQRAYGDDEHGWPNADDVKKGLDKDIRLAIFREREKELLLEGVRYYDARRNGVDYVRKLRAMYEKLSDQDIAKGALYQGLDDSSFEENDLIRQNEYWNGRIQ